VYLTPDAASVRKNHLTGRNHVKLVCDYYEKQAREQGIWNDTEHNYQPTSEALYKGIPGSTGAAKPLDYYYQLASTKILPPPHTLQGLPQPPQRVLHDSVPSTELGNVLKLSSR
jgi:U1 small nuclear ribonucleoprotein C